jgi:hypothetical protein
MYQNKLLMNKPDGVNIVWQISLLATSLLWQPLVGAVCKQYNK